MFHILQVRWPRCFRRKYYCWWLKSCTSWYGRYPIIYKVWNIPGGWPWDFFHQQYDFQTSNQSSHLPPAIRGMGAFSRCLASMLMASDAPRACSFAGDLVQLRCGLVDSEVPMEKPMDVSKTNGGTPKWMVYNGKPYWNGWFGGNPYFWKHPNGWRRSWMIF